MRILFLASRFPSPPLRGDQARAWHQLRLLSARHRVTLLVDAAHAGAEAQAAVAGLGVEVHAVPVRPMARLAGLARGLSGGFPLQSALLAAPTLARRLRELLAERRHDLLHVQLARLEPLVPLRPSIPVVVDLIDALSLNMARRSQRASWPLKTGVALEGRRMARLERALCARRERVTVVSPVDRAALGDHPNVRVNPNGVDLAAFKPGARTRPTQVVFSGNQGYFPNVDAALWFTREVLPRVRRARPEVGLTIAGDRPARALRRLAASVAAVDVTGRVGDLAPLLSSCGVAVAPLLAGSGQLLKLLEAFACATPVVATSLAIAGLELQHERHVLVADGAADFAAHVLRVLGDPELQARLGAAGREVAERHTWDESVAGLERIYAEVAPAGA